MNKNTRKWQVSWLNWSAIAWLLWHWTRKEIANIFHRTLIKMVQSYSLYSLHSFGMLYTIMTTCEYRVKIDRMRFKNKEWISIVTRLEVFVSHMRSKFKTIKLQTFVEWKSDKSINWKVHNIDLRLKRSLSMMVFRFIHIWKQAVYIIEIE